MAQADSQDPEAIVAATRDVDACTGWIRRRSPTNALADYARATEALVQAVRANGVRRVVFQSSVGAEKRTASARSTAWPARRSRSTPSTST
ncbi:NAD(P)H-binding protein [Microbacterium sp. NRRL B-14842]|uniref:NAD(P)H-binding protein n=1 Tax=Microbacterium sp. NRRL B-14842 TaxID=3162881 RepID=UPI003D2894DE